MYSTNIRPESEVRGSLPLINPEPEVAVSHMIYIMLTSYRGKISTYILRLVRTNHNIIKTHNQMLHCKLMVTYTICYLFI